MSENYPENQPSSDRGSSFNWSLLVPVGIIIVGVYLLMGNLGINGPNLFAGWNWGGLVLVGLGALILAKAFGPVQAARASGQPLTRHWRNQLVIGFILVLVGASSLVNIANNLIWPLLLVGVGAALLLSNLTRRA